MLLYDPNCCNRENENNDFIINNNFIENIFIFFREGLKRINKNKVENSTF